MGSARIWNQILLCNWLFLKCNSNVQQCTLSQQWNLILQHLGEENNMNFSFCALGYGSPLISWFRCIFHNVNIIWTELPFSCCKICFHIVDWTSVTLLLLLWAIGQPHKTIESPVQGGTMFLGVQTDKSVWREKNCWGRGKIAYVISCIFLFMV